MIPVTRKAVEDLPSWPLIEPQDLLTAVTELKRDYGWDGTIDSSKWSICLSCSGKNSVNAALGQWLVLDGELRVFNGAAGLDIYDPSQPVDFLQDDTPAQEPAAEPEPEPQTSEDTSVPITRIVR
ncbi:hypothetical protein H7J86_24635 [Mycobacterium hackensackense]|uniref:hypothetical protein n=1 Tax=Mycobacterium hackensackense TaxID=228909 RepID=UPI0022659520|nr:hypothetical protein [Mycobacterium hackensackense]MCV7255355.1 hypothetical protein [Mycobacterium hackensackense]